MSRIKEPFDLYSIADVVEKNYEFCHSATRVFVSLFCFFIFFFSLLKTRATDWSKKRRDSSYSGGLLMSKIWWVFFRLCSDVFFPFSIFLILFRGWHDILKEIEESSLRHGSAVTSSRRGSVTGYFLNRSIFGDFFPYVVVVIILWSLCRHRQHILIEYLMNSVSF